MNTQIRPMFTIHALPCPTTLQGGLVMALGLTTRSHNAGLMHDIVEAYEVVTAAGELIRATKDNEHSDLFHALPWSHGTLGAS
jgi:delta24-sterol reductase